MRHIRLVAILVAALIGLVSCSRDPQVVKKRYFESGNKYFEKARYREASIQYRNAIKTDPKYGAAYYKLALTSLRSGDYGGAVFQLRRAVELVSKDSSDHWDAVVRLSEIYLAARDPTYLEDVKTFTAELLKRDPNSFDAHRLLGDLNYGKATEAFKGRNNQDGLAFLKSATEEYRKADSIKPNQQGVSMQLARSLAAMADAAGAEQLYRGVIERDKTYQPAYTELYRLLVFQRKQDEGEQVLKLAFQNNPKQFGFLTLLALHFYAQKRREEMVTVLSQIKSHAKEFDQAYLTVGDFYLRMGDGDQAIKEYREGMAKDARKKSTY